MSTYSEEVSYTTTMRIAVFASGTGSNALALMQRFNSENDIASVIVLLSNKAECGAVQHARDRGIEVILITRENFISSDEITERLRILKIDWIVLAGFLWKVPPHFVKAFEGRIINLHPSLLPKFGGKGMYGRHVHEAVIAAGEVETGITLHLVNEQYDEGAIFFQASVSIENTDDAQIVEAKVRELERKHFAERVAAFIMEGKKSIRG